MGIGSEVVIVFVLVLANGVFAMSELALMSARPGLLEARAADGDRGAARALRMRREPTRFLSTVQVGITLIGIIAGAFGGATISEELSAGLADVPWLAGAARPIAFTLVVSVITVLSVVVGELVPKRIALTAPEAVAAAIARPMDRLSRLAGPIVNGLESSTELLLGLFRIPDVTERPVTEDELSRLIRQAGRVGVLEPAEQAMVERVFRLADLRAGSLMTPRPKIVWFEATDDWNAVRATTAGLRYARYPVVEGGLDHVLGIVEIVDLWNASATRTPLDLRSLVKKPLYVPETMRALELLDRFRSSGVHFAVVLDEYGGADGIVTLNDLLEALAGVVPRAALAERPSVVRRDDGTWLVDGSLSIHEFCEATGVDVEAWLGDGAGSVRTIAGLVVTAAGRIPVAGDIVTVHGARLEVVDMDGQRVDKVLAALPPLHEERTAQSDLEDTGRE